MRDFRIRMMSGVLAASLVAGCSSDNTSPNNGGGTSLPPTSGQGGGGGTTPAPATASVTIGDIFFKSDHNASSNPAVDTVAVNGTVTWTWQANMSHSVQSLGSPSFTSSDIQEGVGQTYQVMFTTPGTYQYDCAVHGTLMTGMIVVMPATGSSATPPPPSSMPPPSGY
jgi:plastocyanin